MGAPGEGFAYDCERPRHEVRLGAFWIARLPVTNAAHLAFMADDGYARPELWTEEGWAWRQAEDAEAPLYWERDGAGGWVVRAFDEVRPVDPARPLCHVSWHEACAHARWAGARLPTEAEWERAAAWCESERRPRPVPWGDGPPEGRANLDQLAFDVAPAGAFPAGASPCGAEQMLGDVWEWTSTPFAGYPGFRAFPYREYAEVFFGAGHRVLRGRLLGHPAVRRADHLPQLGPARAAADLLGRPTGLGRRGRLSRVPPPRLSRPAAPTRRSWSWRRRTRCWCRATRPVSSCAAACAPTASGSAGTPTTSPSRRPTGASRPSGRTRTCPGWPARCAHGASSPRCATARRACPGGPRRSSPCPSAGTSSPTTEPWPASPTSPGACARACRTTSTPRPGAPATRRRSSCSCWPPSGRPVATWPRACGRRWPRWPSGLRGRASTSC